MSSERYKETTEWLFEQIPTFQNVGSDAYKPGLEGVTRLAAAFGNPHLQFRSIHVGGTNGKGSTSSLLASVMTEAGRRTGLFTSPHLVDFRERIRIDGKMIPEEDVVAFIDRFRAMDLDYEPSFFELTTVMAFEWFARSGVDIAVVEVGLGGRLDSTNIITPEVSVITNISLDHTALLGHTCEEIACEKAGIIKPGVPVVVGRAEGAVLDVFKKKADDAGAPLRLAPLWMQFTEYERTPDYTIYRDTPWGDIRCPLTGECQTENANTALTALDVMHFSNSAAVERGFENVLRNTGLTGRWTTVSLHPRVICDTGHNAGGWEYLGRALSDIASRGTLHVVVGFVNDKDVHTILGMMPRNARYYFATPSVRRGRPSDFLRDEAAGHGLSGLDYESVSAAYAAARAAAGPDDTIFVGGSTFVVADFLCELGIRG